MEQYQKPEIQKPQDLERTYYDTGLGKMPEMVILHGIPVMSQSASSMLPFDAWRRA